MRYQKYFHQYNPRKPNYEELIIGLGADGYYWDLYHKPADENEWHAWPSPLSFDLADYREDKLKGWVMKEIAYEDIFSIIL